MNLPLIVLKYQGNFEQIKVALFKRDLKNQFFYKHGLIINNYDLIIYNRAPILPDYL